MMGAPPGPVRTAPAGPPLSRPDKAGHGHAGRGGELCEQTEPTLAAVRGPRYHRPFRAGLATGAGPRAVPGTLQLGCGPLAYR